MSAILPVTSRYTAKDQHKADQANKFIGWGSSKSSTRAYAKAYGELANCSNYESSDVVFVSVEGARSVRMPLDTAEVLLAVKAKATIVADSRYDRERMYNIGERELSRFLLGNGYVEVPKSNCSLWKHASKV